MLRWPLIDRRIPRRVCAQDLMQEIAASTGRQWIMLVVAIINTTVAILLIAHVMTCIWVGVGEFIQRDDHWLALAALPDDRWSEENAWT